MDKIAMKLVDMNIKTAAGITPGMVSGNAFRNLGKMLMHPSNKKVRMGAFKNMNSAMNLYGRELASTRGKSNPKALKGYLKTFHGMNKMQNIANKYNKPALANNFGAIGQVNLESYSKLKRGINPVPNLYDLL